MPLVPATLTWTQSADSAIAVAGATATYDEFLNKIESLVNATTGWKVTQKTLDAANNRGYIELAPTSTATGITEARYLIAIATVSSGSAVHANNQQLPYSSSSSPRIWVGFSNNANTTGPTNSPYSSSQAYTSNWSRMFLLGGTYPSNGHLFWTVDSAEGLALFWRTSASSACGMVMGRLMELPDGTDALWGLWLTGGNWGQTTDATSAANLLSYAYYLGYNGTYTVGYGAGVSVYMSASGLLYACGVPYQDGNGNEYLGYSSLTYAVFTTIVLSGGLWANGQGVNQLQGSWRQIRRGPAAIRRQRLIDSGVTQGYYLHFNSSTDQTGGIWFDQQR